MFKIFLILSFLSISLFSETKVIESNNEQIIFSYSTEFKGFKEVRTSDNFITYLPNIEKAYQAEGIPGHPIKLIHTELIAIPDENNFTVELIGYPELEEINALMAPVEQYISTDNYNTSYSLSETYFDIKNDDIFNYEYIGISGDKKLLKITFNAAYFDNEKSNIVIPKEFLVRVKYNTPIKTSSVASESRINVLNANVSNSWDLELKEKNKVKLLNNERIYSDGEWYKFKVSTNGVYRITASQLSANGINIPKEKINTIKIIGNGGKPLSEVQSEGHLNQFNEQKIIVNTDNNGNLSEIIFFGSGTKGFEYKNNGKFEKYINWYSNDNYYLFTWGGDEGLRATEEEITGDIVNRPVTYYQRNFYEEDLYNPYTVGGGRQFFGKEFTNLNQTNLLHNLDRSGKIYLKVMVAHNGGQGTYVNIYENNQELNPSIYLMGINDSNNNPTYKVAHRSWRTYELDANMISSDNRSKLNFSYQGNSLYSAFMDYYEIHYPRNFVAINNELEFWTDLNLDGLTEFNINGFSANKKYIYDITNIADPLLQKNKASDMDKAIYSTELTKNNPKRFYITTEIKNISTLEKVTINNNRVTEHNKDVILITDKELLESANKYKEYRESQGEFSVGVFTTDEIYNEFASGVPDIVAIRDFVANAYLTWDNKPQYVILWGDGHTDHRKISYKANNYIPPFLSIDSSGTLDERYSTSFDDFYVRVLGNDALIDLAIGRITINSDEEGQLVLDKIKFYENNSSTDNWRKRITLVADDSYTSEVESSNHVSYSEDIAQLEPMNNFLTNKIYLPEYQTVYNANGRTKPDANKAIIKSLREDGSVVINWTGHGNPTVWSHEGVFTQSKSLKELNNYDKLAFFCAATCEYGRYDQITGYTAAEELLLSSNGGAIAVFAATRLVFIGENNRLNEVFFDVLLSKNPQTQTYRRIGDVLMEVKQLRAGSNDEKYLIIGDPTLKLLFPENNVVIEEINNIDLENNSDMIDLEGLSEINVKGKITDINNNKLSNFNGNVQFSIFDGDEEVNIREFDKDFIFTKYGGILNKSSFVVENGEFTASIMLPKDISYSNRNGRMFAYAINNDNTITAKGNFRDFYVSGVGSGIDNDFDGPIITLFVDSRDFKTGDVVSNEPTLIVDLEDKIGINSTGNGIGHKIEAWVNDSPKSVDLSRNYTTSIGNNRLGSSQIELTNVKVGLNKVTVRAWDIFNNFSIATTYFYIKGDDSDLWVGDIKNYPNPFEKETNIQFRHNLEIPFDANINIYDISGKLLRTISETKYNKFVDEVFWDGKDKNGIPINSGSYYIQVNLKDKNNKNISKSGILSLKVK